MRLRQVEIPASLRMAPCKNFNLSKRRRLLFRPYRNVSPGCTIKVAAADLDKSKSLRRPPECPAKTSTCRSVFIISDSRALRFRLICVAAVKASGSALSPVSFLLNHARHANFPVFRDNRGSIEERRPGKTSPDAPGSPEPEQVGRFLPGVLRQSLSRRVSKNGKIVITGRNFEK